MAVSAEMSDESWWYVLGETRLGPVPRGQLVLLHVDGIVDLDNLVWTEGMKEWLPLGQVDALRGDLLESLRKAKLVAPPALPSDYVPKVALNAIPPSSQKVVFTRHPSASTQNLYDAILGEKNRIYYLTKFRQLDQQGPGLKASWNWPSFLCGGVWALYRKMYGWFFAFWGIAALSNLVEKAGSPGLSALVFFAPWIAFTVFANSLYHRSIKKRIAVAQITIKDESQLLEYLRQKGGVHAWVIWVSGLLPIIGILAAIIIPMFARH